MSQVFTACSQWLVPGPQMQTVLPFASAAPRAVGLSDEVTVCAVRFTETLLNELHRGTMTRWYMPHTSCCMEDPGNVCHIIWGDATGTIPPTSCSAPAGEKPGPAWSHGGGGFQTSTGVSNNGSCSTKTLTFLSGTERHTVRRTSWSSCRWPVVRSVTLWLLPSPAYPALLPESKDKKQVQNFLTISLFLSFFPFFLPPFLPSLSHPPSFFWNWESNPWPYKCWASTLNTELHTVSVLI